MAANVGMFRCLRNKMEASNNGEEQTLRLTGFRANNRPHSRIHSVQEFTATDETQTNPKKNKHRNKAAEEENEAPKRGYQKSVSLCGTKNSEKSGVGISKNKNKIKKRLRGNWELHHPRRRSRREVAQMLLLSPATLRFVAPPAKTEYNQKTVQIEDYKVSRWKTSLHLGQITNVWAHFAVGQWVLSVFVRAAAALHPQSRALEVCTPDQAELFFSAQH